MGTKTSNLPTWLQSSTGEGLPLRVKSFLVGVLPAVLAISHLTGNPILEVDANMWVESLVVIVESAVALIAAVYHFAGWVRARYYKENNLGKFSA